MQFSLVATVNTLYLQQTCLTTLNADMQSSITHYTLFSLIIVLLVALSGFVALLHETESERKRCA